MKRILNQISCLFLIGVVAVSSCKEDEGLKPADSLTTKEFTYNLATKKFTPEVELNGNLNSPSGIKLVYYYVLRNGKSPQLVHTEAPAVESQNDYTFTIPNSAFAQLDMTDATGLKVMVRHLDNTSFEGLVKIVPFTPEKPALTEFPVSITPDLTGGTALITGKVTAESGLAKIEIFDDFNGEFVLVETITGLNDATSYTLNYNYPFRKRASQVKIVATDLIGVPAEVIVKLDVEYMVNVFRDVFMTAHGTGTNTIFLETTGTTLSNCSLVETESTMAFLYYGTGTGPAFYSPTNTGNVAKNMKCNGTGWEIQNPTVLRATRFKVLIKGSSPGVDNIYATFNDIERLDDAFFAQNGITAPTGSNAKFDPTVTASTNTFNLNDALLYVRIPDVGEPTSYKNAIIRVKEATSATTSSTIKFDIIVQK